MLMRCATTLALCGFLAACQPLGSLVEAPVSTGSPGSAASSSPVPTEPGIVPHGMLADPHPLESFWPQPLVVGEPLRLPTSTDRIQVTWELPEAYRALGRLEDGRTLIPTAPGALSLKAKADGVTRWYRFAIQDEANARRLRLHSGRQAFPRPIVLRELSAWAQTWTGWWNPPASAFSLLQAPPTTAPVPASGPPSAAPPPPPAPRVDFSQHHILLVDIDMRAQTISAMPVVTHVVGNVVHLAIQDSYIEGQPNPLFASPAPGQPSPDLGGIRTTRGFAFQIPKLPAGVSVQLAPFPEAPESSRVTAEAEASAGQAPFPDASPGFLQPAGLPEVRFLIVGGPGFQAYYPSGDGPGSGILGGNDTALVRSTLYDKPPYNGGQVAWWSEIESGPAGTTSMSDALAAIASHESVAGLQVEPAETVEWAGHQVQRLRVRGERDGRPVTGAVYLGDRAGARVRFSFLVYEDLEQSKAFAGLEASIESGWRWR